MLSIDCRLLYEDGGETIIDKAAEMAEWPSTFSADLSEEQAV